MTLEGRTALITGGGRGIGHRITPRGDPGIVDQDVDLTKDGSRLLDSLLDGVLVINAGLEHRRLAPKRFDLGYRLSGGVLVPPVDDSDISAGFGHGQ